MYKFATLYYQVDDEDVLENFFANTHLQLAEQLPGLVKSEVSRVRGKPGGDSRFHLIYALYFATQQSFELSLMSESGVKLMEALKPWADAHLIIWYYADSFEEVVERRGPEIDFDIP